MLVGLINLTTFMSTIIIVSEVLNTLILRFWLHEQALIWRKSLFFVILTVWSNNTFNIRIEYDGELLSVCLRNMSHVDIFNHISWGSEVVIVFESL